MVYEQTLRRVIANGIIKLSSICQKRKDYPFCRKRKKLPVLVGNEKITCFVGNEKITCFVIWQKEEFYDVYYKYALHFRFKLQLN